MPHARGFTWVEALVVAAVAVVGLVILLVVLPGLRMGTGGHGRQYPALAQLRGIHQGMVIYAQSNKLPGQNTLGFFPGLNPDGTHGTITVEERFKILLDVNAFTPEYLISPADSNKTDWHSGPLTTANYSYAMLQVPAQGGRHDEWAETINTQAIVLSDRNTGTTQQPASIWSARGGPWQGTVVHNDNSTGFESTDTFATEYAGIAHANDKLFEAAGDDDAYLIHSGN